jgi:hypothetical protein
MAVLPSCGLLVTRTVLAAPLKSAAVAEHRIPAEDIVLPEMQSTRARLPDHRQEWGGQRMTWILGIPDCFLSGSLR